MTKKVKEPVKEPEGELESLPVTKRENKKLDAWVEDNIGASKTEEVKELFNSLHLTDETEDKLVNLLTYLE